MSEDLRDYFLNKRLEFQFEFNLYPTHYIITLEDYKKVQLLNEYLPQYKAKDLKETLFGLNIIITDNVDTSKCAILH